MHWQGEACLEAGDGVGGDGGVGAAHVRRGVDVVEWRGEHVRLRRGGRGRGGDAADAAAAAEGRGEGPGRGRAREGEATGAGGEGGAGGAEEGPPGGHGGRDREEEGCERFLGRVRDGVERMGGSWLWIGGDGRCWAGCDDRCRWAYLLDLCLAQKALLQRLCGMQSRPLVQIRRFTVPRPWTVNEV
jgi:hypothetical protein